MSSDLKFTEDSSGAHGAEVRAWIAAAALQRAIIHAMRTDTRP
jgi:hypothetical protein